MNIEGTGRLTRTLVGFVLARLGVAVVVIGAASIVVFALLEAAPGDAATQFLGSKATPETLEALRADLGLDRPVWVRYLDWVGGALTGDLGESMASGRPIADLIGTPAMHTAALTGVAFAAVLLIGVVGGIAAGYRSTARIDRALSMAALVGLSMPEFVIGIVLITVCALGLKLLPAVSLIPSSGQLADRPEVLVLPAATLAVVAGSYVLRLVRGIVASVMVRPSVEAARLDGIGPVRVLFVHVLPQVIGPVVTAVVVMVPYLIGGAVVVERLFGYPGLGSQLVAAVNGRDQPAVMAIILILSTITVVGYALSDVLARAADPYRPRRS